MIFDLSDPEITRYELAENMDEDISEGTEKRKGKIKKEVLDPEGFGVAYEVYYDRCIFLNEMQYEGDWSIMQPATVFRICGNVSSNTLQQVRLEAKQLLDSFCRQRA